MFAHQPVVGAADFVNRGAGGDAEDRVRIVLWRRPHMSGADAGIVGLAEAEQQSDLAQVGVLGGADFTVGKGDVKESTEQVFEHGAVFGEKASYLPRIAFKAMRAA